MNFVREMVVIAILAYIAIFCHGCGTFSGALYGGITGAKEDCKAVKGVWDYYNKPDPSPMYNLNPSSETIRQLMDEYNRGN